MIPSQYATQSAETARVAIKQPSKTYNVDQKTKRIQGHINGLNAIVQAVTLIMNTERYAYEIFDDDYGAEIETLIGQDGDFVKTVLEQRVTDALMRDDRITGIEYFEIGDLVGETMAFSFTVISEYGAVTMNYNTAGGVTFGVG